MYSDDFLCKIHNLQIFSQSRLAFSLFNNVIWMSPENFNESFWFWWCLIYHVFSFIGSYFLCSKKYLPNPRWQKIFPMLSSRSLSVCFFLLACILRFMLYFELIFIDMWGKDKERCFFFFFYIWISNCFWVLC